MGKRYCVYFDSVISAYFWGVTKHVNLTLPHYRAVLTGVSRETAFAFCMQENKR